MLREALHKAGYAVWEASNGADALAQWGARINEIDLVVTDIVMPKMNGLRLAEELRSRRPEMKVVFMSGHSLELINSQGAPGSRTGLVTEAFRPAGAGAQGTRNTGPGSQSGSLPKPPAAPRPLEGPAYLVLVRASSRMRFPRDGLKTPQEQKRVR